MEEKLLSHLRQLKSRQLQSLRTYEELERLVSALPSLPPMPRQHLMKSIETTLASTTSDSNLTPSVGLTILSNYVSSYLPQDAPTASSKQM